MELCSGEKRNEKALEARQNMYVLWEVDRCNSEEGRSSGSEDGVSQGAVGGDECPGVICDKRWQQE